MRCKLAGDTKKTTNSRFHLQMFVSNLNQTQSCHKAIWSSRRKNQSLHASWLQTKGLFVNSSPSGFCHAPGRETSADVVLTVFATRQENEKEWHWTHYNLCFSPIFNMNMPSSLVDSSANSVHTCPCVGGYVHTCNAVSWPMSEFINALEVVTRKTGVYV